MDFYNNEDIHNEKVKVEKKSILSSVVYKVLIDEILDSLSDRLTEIKIQTKDMMGEGLKINGRNILDSQNRIVASFATEEMAMHMMRNSPDFANNSASFGISKVNEFRKFWDDDDIDGQKALFESIYLLTAIHLGDDMASDMRNAFNEMVSFRSLSNMMIAVSSGYQLLKTEMESLPEDESPLSGTEESERYIFAIEKLINLANNDSFGIDLKEMVIGATKSWAQHLESMGDDISMEKSRELKKIIPIFQNITLLPNKTGKPITHARESGSLDELT